MIIVRITTNTKLSTDDFFDHQQSPLDCQISDGHGIVDQSDAKFLTVDFVDTSTKIHRKSDKRSSKISSECTSVLADNGERVLSLF